MSDQPPAQDPQNASARRGGRAAGGEAVEAERIRDAQAAGADARKAMREAGFGDDKGAEE